MAVDALPWAHPLDAAASLAAGGKPWALLYSGQQLGAGGRYSYLALEPLETVAAETFSALSAKLSRDRPAPDNAWFGYFGYEMLHELETFPREERRHIALPALWFTRFGLVLRFDHAEQKVECFRVPGVEMPEWYNSFQLSESPPPLRGRIKEGGDRALAHTLPPHPNLPPQGGKEYRSPQIASLTSPMTKAEYLAIVADTREAIRRGDFYQANITRKFTGRFASPPDALALFRRLAEASPAVYSACLFTGEAAILSSSPERFLLIDAEGNMESRPIKGTAPRESDPALLAKSEKDRAENLMIVDLMRNDLARACEPGSVKVERLFEVSSYATLHHMASTVTGQKRSDVSTLDAVKACFPPGSMTGAPKIRAMDWCLKHEAITRGVYSGALGWFGGDGSADLSVVIRTLVIEGDRFEFQVGGGIVADSEPEKEWTETMTKARGILQALGVEEDTLKAI